MELILDFEVDIRGLTAFRNTLRMILPRSHFQAPETYGFKMNDAWRATLRMMLFLLGFEDRELLSKLNDGELIDYGMSVMTRIDKMVVDET